VATYEGGKNMIQTALNAFGKLDIVVHVRYPAADRMIFNRRRKVGRRYPRAFEGDV